jgi:hypothetical protein
VYDVPLDPVTCTEADLDAVTVRVSDCPAEMVLALAVIAMMGFALVETVTVVLAEAVAPVDPVAVAVYVVVDDGVIVTVPPVAARL